LELGILSIKTIVIIVATFTGGDGNDQYVFDKKFENKEQCSNYVRDNFNALNAHVNKNYNYRLDSPNLFYCINKELFSKHLKEMRNRLTGVKI
jgi:hypothetical protein